MLNALGSVLAVLLMIAIGFSLARRGFFAAKGDAFAGAGLVSRLVVNVALPAYMVANLMGGYDKAKLLSMAPGLPVPFLSMGLAMLLCASVARILRVRPGRRGAFTSMASLSNTIFIGLPVNLMLFGEESLPYALLYYIANTTMFWTLGVYGMARDGAALAGRPSPALLSAAGLKRLVSPPLLGLIASIALIMLGIRLPKAIMDAARILGSMTTPLSMLFIGIVVARVDWRMLRLDRDIALAVAGRFILSPALLVLMLRLTDLPSLMKQVFLVQAMMPAMTQTPILADAYGADAEYAGVTTSLTTILSLAVIPACLALSRLVL